MSSTALKYITVAGISVSLMSLIVSSNAKLSNYNSFENANKNIAVAIDSPDVNLPYNFTDQSTGDPLNYPNSGGLMLNNPSNINTSVEYDPSSGNYNINQTMGGMNYRPPTYMDSEEYQQYMFRKQTKSYWQSRSHAESQNNQQSSSALPKLHVGGEIFDRIFGGNTVDIRPNGSAELIFAYKGTKTENPAIPVRQRKVRTFDFDMKIQLNVIGKIGDKLKLTTSYNTQATFDYENQMKLEYTGYEDEIIKKIEAGNVNMPLTGSLITGSQTLFGVKTQLQFGRLTVTGIVSQQKGKKSEVEVTGGAQTSKFEVNGDNYEANRHFFLSQYFRDNYNSSLSTLPFVSSLININRIEVWVSNTNMSTTDVRDVVAFSELGEGNPHIPTTIPQIITDIQPTENLPYNNQNNLYSLLDTSFRNASTVSNLLTYPTGIFNGTMQAGISFEKLNARKLQPSEYTFNARLGFISLNQQLNPDQVLCVAFQYTYNGQVYQVGEFSTDGISSPNLLYLKMLKSTIVNTKKPMWNLMMKNVYSLGAYQINSKDFRLQVFYNNAQTGTDINYLPVPDAETRIKGKPLIQVVGLDRLDQQNDRNPDGVFDFIDGVTINANNGRVYFPVVEPFGDYLRSQFNDSLLLANTYVFDPLYDSTKTAATTLFPNLNRFKIKGQYQSSSSSEISLGAPNIPQGSVTVTAGGLQLVENQDYTVDYNLGRVKIINDGILNSGTPIKVSLESNALFAIQAKTLMGAHLDYRVNKDFNIGGTILNLTERPVTRKINQGDEPVSNTIWGLDANHRTEAPFLTRWLDKLPLLETKEMSTITTAAEFAYLVPGHSKAIGKNGNSYIDDFEGSQSSIDMRSPSAWKLSGIPQDGTLFPEAFADSTKTGFNRAKLAWYTIDPLFLRKTNGLTPSHLSNTDMSNHFAREVIETEIFPNKQSPTGQPVQVATFDLAYYPNERGPYNFDVLPNASAHSAGIDTSGKLNNPETRWAGIMRSISTNDFESANVEYIQFWMMDPFNSDNPNADWNTTGELYFNLGNVSEDILKDGYRSSENALPTAAHPASVTQTPWGDVPVVQPLVNAFNNTSSERTEQDIGLDGLKDGVEQSRHSGFVNAALAVITNTAERNRLQNDPSNDNFHYFRGSDYDGQGLSVLKRYKDFNGVENNSRTTESSPEPYPTQGTTLPDGEDINRDNNMSTIESYYQYHISLKPSDFAMGVGNNYITNVYQTNAQNVKDGTTKPITWYQFKIPVKVPEGKVGNIEGYQSIRFFRMFFKNVDKPIVLRFARLELVRGEWRKYQYDLTEPGLYIPNDDASTTFDVAAVNIEENGNKQPVNYVLPPGIDRQTNAASANLIKLNEQSLSLTVCNLEDGKSRAAFKNVNFDVRSYKKMKMFVHAEASPNTSDVLNNGDLHAFIRLGTDYTDNYYEYEVPLVVTPAGVYNGSSDADRYIVWPEANEMVIEFAKLQSAKQQRNNAIYSGAAALTSEYTVMLDGGKKITIKGNPNMSALKTIMIGIRNPKHNSSADNDDGLPKCGAVWFNELRLTDFNEEGGWAATARTTMKLADLGTLSLSGNIYTPGFGSIENKVSERKRERLIQYNLSSNLELGKFIPEEWNVHVPMYVDYSETFITPQFNPLDPDIELDNVIRDKTIPEEDRKKIKRITQDYTKRNSLNFSNVRKDRGKNSKKNHIYDIENWSASYAYSKIYKRNVNIEYNSQVNQRGGLIYNYSPQPKNIRPFAKSNSKFMKSKYMTLIREINFYPYPNKLGFSTDVQRDYASQKNRNITEDDVIIIPTFNKRFVMNRNYDLKYDITKGLKLDFNAMNQERIIEPDGDITDQTKDTLRREILSRIKTTNYNHATNLNYTIPINKIPLFDFTTASVRYGSTYSWTRSPIFNTLTRDADGKLISIPDTLGNTIQNSRNIQWTGQANLTTLYNKIPYLKKINQKSNNKNKPNNPISSAMQNNKNNAGADTTKKKDNQYEIFEYVARLIMTVKSVNVTYSTTRGTMLPGYKGNSQFLGMDEHFSGPTPGFLFGSQKDIRPMAIAKSTDDDPYNDWLVKTPSINNLYTRTYTENLNLRANAEPLPDLKIELTATRTQSRSYSEFFRWSRDSARYLYQSPTESGNFSTSILTYKTSFRNADQVFQKFLDSRVDISKRWGELNPNSVQSIGGYAEGYNAESQEVLIPAFLAAYSGKNPGSNRSKLDPFKQVPLPNWRLTYDGLSKIEKLKKFFKTVTLSHAYRSTYNIGGYTNNLLYGEKDGFAFVREQVSSISNNPNFIPKYQINTATITEQWSPLIKIDFVLQNSLLLNVEYKTDRNISLGLTSKTLTEVRGREIIGGIGYRFRNVGLGKNVKIGNKPIRSDVNLKADISFRKNETVMRRIVEGVSQSTGGTNIISLKMSADYIINDRINIRVFYDRIYNKPVISTSFPTTNTNAGLSLRITLSN